MSDKEVKTDKTESSDSAKFKENRIRHAGDVEEEDLRPSKVAKLDENILEENNQEDVAVSDEEDLVDDEEEYDDDEEVDLEDEGNDDDAADGSDSSFSDEDNTQTAVSCVEDCQLELDQMSQMANEEILKVEQKYNTARKPAYEQRNKYIKKISGFWAKVFSNHSELKRVLTKDDLTCFQYLKTIELDDLEAPKSGFSIKFHFAENPFFTNTCITKEYLMTWNEKPSCCCTAITWKPAMNLTRYNDSSFFSWFCSQSDASTDDIAEIIKEELWPNPLSFYNKSQSDEVHDTSISDDASDEEEEEEVSQTNVSSHFDATDNDESAAYISSDEDELEDEDEWVKAPSGGKHGKSKENSHHHPTSESYDAVEDDEDDEEYDDDEEEDKVVHVAPGDDDEEEEVGVEEARKKEEFDQQLLLHCTQESRDDDDDEMENNSEDAEKLLLEDDDEDDDDEETKMMSNGSIDDEELLTEDGSVDEKSSNAGA